MNLLFYPEFASNTGTGHFMRCYALAEYASLAGCRVSFILSRSCVYFEGLLKKINADILWTESSGWSETSALFCCNAAIEAGYEWIVLDSYSLRSSFLQLLKGVTSKVAIIDDFGFEGLSCDLIINQNSFASEVLYFNVQEACLLLGPEYVLLRSEIRVLADWERSFHYSVSKLLISLGGSDPNNIVQHILKILDKEKFFGLETVLIAGADNAYFHQACEVVTEFKGQLQVVSVADNMAEWLKWADIAIGAGGTSVWERCIAALPSLTFKIADNQQRVVEDLAFKRCLVDVGWSYESLSKLCFELERIVGNSGYREMMARKSRKLIDGCGCSRVYDKMKSLIAK